MEKQELSIAGNGNAAVATIGADRTQKAGIGGDTWPYGSVFLLYDYMSLLFARERERKTRVNRGEQGDAEKIGVGMKVRKELRAQ